LQYLCGERVTKGATESPQPIALILPKTAGQIRLGKKSVLVLGLRTSIPRSPKSRKQAGGIIDTAMDIPSNESAIRDLRRPSAAESRGWPPLNDEQALARQMH
jgi:hypothetical protein